jgi:hypothetical protein
VVDVVADVRGVADVGEARIELGVAAIRRYRAERQQENGEGECEFRGQAATLTRTGDIR